MQKQKESLSTSMAKLIMVVSLIVGVGAVIGVMGYYLAKQTDINLPMIGMFTLILNIIINLAIPKKFPLEQLMFQKTQL